MSELYSSAGSVSYTNLLADPQGADVISIPVKPGSGTVPAGTVMYREESGLWSPAASAQITASYQLVVLKETVTVANAVAGTAVVAEDALAYRAGCFIDGKVVLASNAALSAANKVVLRAMGIVFDKKETTSTFTNSYTQAQNANAEG